MTNRAKIQAFPSETLKIIYRLCLAVGYSFALCLVLEGQPAFAANVDRVDVNLQLQSDNSVAVTETYTFDFGTTPGKGIFRRINLRDAVPNSSLRKFVFGSVTNEKGALLPCTVQKSTASVYIKMPDRNLVGKHVYQLRYTISPAVTTTRSYRELLFNAVGNPWKMPLQKVTVSLQPYDAKQASAVGLIASLKGFRKADAKIGQNRVEISTPILLAGETLTLDVRFPLSPVPVSYATVAPQQIPVWPLLILTFLLAPVYMVLWILIIRNQANINAGNNKQLFRHWTPPDSLSPSELALLLDHNCSPNTVLATMIDLACRGFLKIREVASEKSQLFMGKDYHFIRLNPPQRIDSLLPCEREMLYVIFKNDFERYLSDWQKDFRQDLVCNVIFQSLMQKQYIRNTVEQNNERMRKRGLNIILIGVVAALIVSLVGAALLFYWHNQTLLFLLPGLIGIALAGLILFLAADNIPIITAAGAKEVGKYLAFKRFIASGNQSAIAKLLKKDPNIFDRFFAYALVMNDVEEWSASMQGYIDQIPDWFELLNADPSMSLKDWSKEVARQTSLIGRALSRESLPQK